jgi:hypothetical protein
VVKKLKDADLIEFWEKEFTSLPAGSLEPIYNKLSPLIGTSPTLRNILCQQGSIDFDAIVSGNTIFLVDLASAFIGEDAVSLLGTFVVNGLFYAALRRVRIPPEQRRPCRVFLDEFQRFSSSMNISFERILSESRKFALYLTMANQYVAQLEPSVRHAVFGNVGAITSFRLSADDAHIVSKYLPGFPPEALTSLPVGAAVCRLGAGQACNVQMYPPPPKSSTDFTTEIIAHSRRTYARPRADVEKGFAVKPPPPPKPKPKGPDANLDDFIK